MNDESLAESNGESVSESLYKESEAKNKKNEDKKMKMNSSIGVIWGSGINSSSR